MIIEVDLTSVARMRGRSSVKEHPLPDYRSRGLLRNTLGLRGLAKLGL